MAKSTDFRYNTGATRVPWAAVGENYNTADLMEIIPEIPYDSNRDNYNALADYAKKEHAEDMRPAIKNDINIADYDTIFIGYTLFIFL